MNRKQKLKELYKLYLSRVLSKPLVKPKTVTLTLTSKCNLRCIMCDHWKLKSNEELSLEEIKNLIDQITGWGVEEIELSGGEPFMRKDVWDVIAYASSKNVGMNITTNGTLFTRKDIERLFGYKINRLQISLDGVGKTHDKIRGVKGTYKRMIKNVNRINDLRKKKHSDLKINATTVIMQQNINELVSLVHLTKKLGFDSITFQPINDSNLTVGKKKEFNPERVKDLEELDKQVDELIRLRTETSYIGNSETYLKAVKDFFRSKKVSRVKCYAGFVGAIITPQGMIWTCMGDYGNLKKDGIKEAWQSKEAEEKRRLIKKCENPCLYPCYLNSKGEPLIRKTLSILKNG